MLAVITRLLPPALINCPGPLTVAPFSATGGTTMLTRERHPQAPVKPQQTVVYVSYGVALGLPTLFIVAGILAARRRRISS